MYRLALVLFAAHFLVTPASAESGKSSTEIGLFQVILNVQDMEVQLAFWRDVMGFPVVYPHGAEPEKEDFVRLDTGGAYLVLHTGRRAANAGDEPRLSFMTADLSAARARVLEAGVQVDEVRSPAPGVLVVDCRDPEGNAFHLEARVPNEPSAGDVG